MKFLDISSNSEMEITDAELMFAGCNNLENIDLSNKNCLEYDRRSIFISFMGCNKLKNISLPKGLPLMLDEEELPFVFTGCTSLETIKAPEELKDANWLEEIRNQVEIIFY